MSYQYCMQYPHQRVVLADPLAPPHGARGNATAIAASLLHDLIVRGEIVPGSRVRERETCERLGLSRTPLREALKILEAEGLVIISPNRGAVVVELSLDTIGAAYEALAVLEANAAEFAARRMTDTELDAIGDLHAVMVKHAREGRMMEYFHSNQAVHHAIVDAAKNPVLSRIYRGESRRIWRYRYASNDKIERWEDAVREHEQILSALQMRDSSLLRELIRAHMMAGWLAARRNLIEATGAHYPTPAKVASGKDAVAGKRRPKAAKATVPPVQG